MLAGIKGLGPKTIDALKSLNIVTLNDLITYYPFRYNVYKPSDINIDNNNNNILLNGVIVGDAKIFFIRKNLNRISFKFDIGTQIINVVIFNRSFIKRNLINGKEISVIGKYERKNNTLTASDIKLIPIIKTKIEGVYHLNHLIKKSIFIKAIENALYNVNNLDYNVPQEILNNYNFISKKEAIKEIHFPTSSENLKKAKIALLYEELFEFMLKINYLKLKRNNNYSVKKVFSNEKVENFINKLPFELTGDQKKAIEEIGKDFNSDNVMNRLVIGDVGSGKTIVAFIALYMNYLSGYQGVLMAPTEILANQHFINIKNVFKSENLNIELLTSSVSKKNRKSIIDRLYRGEIDILIGTHSVLNDEVIFNNLGLVITDEQHRFGVKQRRNLQNKGLNVDVLFLSATPIPRTLALTLFGDMSISEIKTKPNNRKEIKTKLYSTKDIKKVLSKMIVEIKIGNQIYVVAPLINDEDDNNGMYDVNKLKDSFNTAFNGKVPIEILHGKLSSLEKNNIMEDFKKGKIKVLISTTVIEVGVDVKNATMMVIFNGERFGLATLHQLRGRIGRNDKDAFCAIISDYDIPRLKIMEETNDGFIISEKDFELRGSGDLFGIRQSGDMLFKLADLNKDFKVLKQCDKDSREFLEKNIDNLNDYANINNILKNNTNYN